MTDDGPHKIWREPRRVIVEVVSQSVNRSVRIESLYGIIQFWSIVTPFRFSNLYKSKIMTMICQS